jgi:integrase
MLAVIGSMYAYAERAGIVAEGLNPARKIEKFKESRRERFLTAEELERLGRAIREAETVGIPWRIETTKPTIKHLAKPKHRFTQINEFAAAALRLLLFTGCRLREILNLRWENVDMERGLLFLPDSKTGRKTVVLNGPALSVLCQLSRIGPYVITGADPEKPRPDLHRAWQTVIKRADLLGVRLHDLRHTYASFGAGGGFGLPILGRLLGHTQPATTARYAHLDNDPLRHASEAIAQRIDAALQGNANAPLTPLRRIA